MEKFIEHTGLVCPLDRTNVDTDAIIPKQFLKSIYRTGYGPFLFDELRYLDRGEIGMDCSKRPLNPDFVLNQPRYQGCTILLSRRNFGCGSSREHAPWALLQYGFRAVIAPSFADIFHNNSLKNGLLTVELPEDVVSQLFEMEKAAPEGLRLTVDLANCTVRGPGGFAHPFAVSAFRRECLMKGWDDISVTLGKRDEIAAFEARHLQERPWLTKTL